MGKSQIDEADPVARNQIISRSTVSLSLRASLRVELTGQPGGRVSLAGSDRVKDSRLRTQGAAGTGQRRLVC